MEIKALNDFVGCSILIEMNGFNLQSSNQKLRLPQWRGCAVQLTILPQDADSSTFKGKGSLKRAQENVCADNCSFRVGHGLSSESCYVNHLSSKARKAQAYREGLNPIIPLYDPLLLRLSVWGDIGKAIALDPRVKPFVESLLKRAELRLSYVSDFSKLQDWTGLFLASCQERAHVDKAQELGLKMYLGTQRALERAQELDVRPLYKCPASGQADSRFACSTCSIRCDGLRNVVAHSVSVS